MNKIIDFFKNFNKKPEPPKEVIIIESHVKREIPKPLAVIKCNGIIVNNAGKM